MRASHCGEHCWHGGKVYAEHQYWQKRHSGAISRAWAPGPSAAVHGGAITTTAFQSRPSRLLWSRASSGSTPPPSTACTTQRDRGGRSHEAHRPRQGGAFHRAVWSGGMKHRCCTRSWTAPPFTATCLQRASSRMWRTACAACTPIIWMCCTPTGRPRFRHLPAGRDGGSHDEAEGAGQDPCHRCIQRHGRHHPRLLQVRPAGCHSGKVQSAHPPCGKQLLPTCRGAGRFGAGILSAGAGPADRQGDYGNHLPRGQHPQLQPQLPARPAGHRRWICWQSGAT